MARNQDDEAYIPDSTIPLTTQIAGAGSVTEVSSANVNLTVSDPTTTPNLTVVAAPKLNPGRTINGVAFDGTANITIPVGSVTSVGSSDSSVTVTNPTTTPNLVVATCPASGLTGTTLASGVVTSSLTSVGTLSSLTMGGDIVLNTGSGTKVGTATGQKLAFWNSAPVAQQVLATGAGHTVDDVITLLQTLGLCKQS